MMPLMLVAIFLLIFWFMIEVCHNLKLIRKAIEEKK